MQIHPEIKFHGVGRSPWVETYIDERVQRLERFAEASSVQIVSKPGAREESPAS